jgi:hypothetical protein
VTELNQSEQAVAQKTVCILLLRGQDPDGTQIYAYVGVRADMLEEFMKAQATGMFYPEDYGVIIESGEGEPSDEVKQRMTEEYGFNHEMMVNLPDSDSAAQMAEQVEAMETEMARQQAEAAYYMQYPHLAPEGYVFPEGYDPAYYQQQYAQQGDSHYPQPTGQPDDENKQ